jgi:hypothetical protein
MQYMLALAVAALLLGTGTARADTTDDTFVSQLQSRGITLPASVSPSALGNSVCVYMKMGHTMIETAYNLSQNGFQGTTFTAKDAGYIAVAAHDNYCPNTSISGGS